MKKTRARRFVLSAAVALFATLSLSFLPHAVHAETSASLSAKEQSKAEIDEMVERMLSAGDYVEGEAIVCYLSADSDDLTAQASDLLANSEHLSKVTSQQYAEATGQAIPATGEGELTAQSAGSAVEITMVRSDDATTSELLRMLLRDPRVLSAEPNYICSYADEGTDNTTTDETSEVKGEEDVEEPEAVSKGDESTVVQHEGEGEEPVAVQPVVEGEAEAEDVPAGPVADNASEPTLTAQSDPSHSASKDLTGYQWFSVGTASMSSQHPNWSNPGINAPNWNVPGATNAGGVVAIMDSGIDFTHPDLSGVMYEFSPELQAELGCGKYGYAPSRKDKGDITDINDHGTHCAGIVAAEWNGSGVSGIAGGTKLIGVAVPGDDFFPTNYSVVKGYDFLIRAAEAGVDIRAVNRSIELPPTTNAMDVMVQAAGEVGIVTTIASGNASLDLEDLFIEGAQLQPSPYVLRVNASDMRNRKASFSNYGQNVTDLFAPGTAILSTVPNTDEEKRYYPSADSDPLFFKTDFNYQLVDAQSNSNDLQVVGISKRDYGLDDSSSQMVEIAATAESTVELFLDVPTGRLNASDLQNVALAFTTENCTLSDVALGAVLDREGADHNNLNVLSGEFEGHAASTNYLTDDGWSFVYLHILNPEGMGALKHVVDALENDCVRLTLSFKVQPLTEETASTVTGKLYIDQIGIGKPGNDALLPYQYFSGTSMAAPAAAASAAIVSQDITGVDPATRAATTVRKLKSAVHQAEGYAGYCKQNGQIDLSLLGQASGHVPTIDSVDVLGESLVINGTGFSSGGTLTLGGKQAEGIPWSDNSIVAHWPEGLVSGLIPITVKTDNGAEVCRAFILEAPEQFRGNVSLYEHDMTPINHRTDGRSVTVRPSSITATEDGVLYAVAEEHVSDSRAVTPALMRSDDHGSSWTPVTLPRVLMSVHLAAGDGKVFFMGVQADVPYSESMMELYSIDTSTDAFTLLGTYDEGDIDFGAGGNLAYVNGHLYIVDWRLGAEDMSKPSHMSVQRFSDGFKTVTDPYLLTCEFPCYGVGGGVQAAVVENSIYVLGTDEYDPDGLYADFLSTKDGVKSKTPTRTFVGLERVDVAADGTLTCTNLSDTLVGIPELGMDGEEIALAACKEGVFLVSSQLAESLPADTERTDTFVLKPGAAKFEPYTKTLSYAPMTEPIAVCSPDGWLHAFAISDYENSTIFGRATKVATNQDPQPEPEPQPEHKPRPESEPQTKPESTDNSTPAWRSSSKVSLPKTDDPAAATLRTEALLALTGLACAACGLVAKRRS